MKTVITYSVKMKILQHVSALLRICMWQRRRYQLESLAKSAIQHIFVLSHPVWRAGCLHQYHWDCCIAYDENKTFELVFSSLEVEASLRGLLGSMVGCEGDVVAFVLQDMQ